MAKILIIEDEESIRRLLRYDLKHAGHDVETAADGEKGLELALQNDFDVIIIDWMLPKLSGIEIVKTLRAKQIIAVLIMVTAKDEEQDILEAFELGVDDYCIKPFSPRQLAARIHAHLRRFNSEKDLDQLDFGNVHLSLKERMVTISGERLELTKKEYDLLLYLCEHLNQIMSREQILNDIWDFNYDGDTRIVDVHIFKLRNKLERADIRIKSSRGVGYVAKIDD